MEFLQPKHRAAPWRGTAPWTSWWVMLFRKTCRVNKTWRKATVKGSTKKHSNSWEKLVASSWCAICSHRQSELRCSCFANPDLAERVTRDSLRKLPSLLSWVGGGRWCFLSRFLYHVRNCFDSFATFDLWTKKGPNRFLPTGDESHDRKLQKENITSKQTYTIFSKNLLVVVFSPCQFEKNTSVSHHKKRVPSQLYPQLFGVNKFQTTTIWNRNHLSTNVDLLKIDLLDNTPLKTKMTSWNTTIFNGKYMLHLHSWWILHCHVSFLRGYPIGSMGRL